MTTPREAIATEYGEQAVLAYERCFGTTFTSNEDAAYFEDNHEGHHDSGADFAMDLADNTGALPGVGDWPVNCIDWERAWRELRISGEYSFEADDPKLEREVQKADGDLNGYTAPLPGTVFRVL